ncbi:MAG: Cytochrome c biogenesis protein CcsB [Firmicutes bacterium]|nr:Cytochrome c biogenesis protein CcsB [Bacillota bacterium]
MTKTKTDATRQTATPSPLEQTLVFLGSMRFGIALLLALSLLSAYATFFPLAFARERIYGSWWFLGAMGLGALNLSLCTGKSIGPRFRQAFRPTWPTTLAQLRQMPVSCTIKVSSGDVAAKKLATAFKQLGLATNRRDTGPGTAVFLRGERGRLGYFGSIATHIGILLVLVGGMYGSLTGFDLGGSARKGGSIDLPAQELAIRVEDIRVTYNDPAGVVRPRVASQLRISQRGQEVATGAVAINEPLRFDGITVYHSTFLWVAHVTLSHPETGAVLHELALVDHETINLPGMPLAIGSAGFFPDFTVQDGRPLSRTYKTNRPALVYRVVQEGRPLPLRVLEPDMPLAVTTPKGPMVITLIGYEKAVSYSVSRNLGRPYLFAGSMIMLAGLFLSFFMAPQRIFAGVEANGEIVVGGRGFVRHHGIEHILANIKSRVEGEES